MNWEFSAPLRASFLPLTRRQFDGLSRVEQVTYLSLAIRAVTAKVDEVLAEPEAKTSH